MRAGRYLSPQGLDALLAYKYVGGEYSWLDLRLNGFWAWCAELLPRSMAPNLVTLVGTAHLLVIAALAQAFDPQLRGQSPWWVYTINAWCLFVYQTMDAVDGKQARRTGSSSPLGQLFDHGCDSLGTTIIAIGICSALGFGGSMHAVAVIATVQVPFYLCQWEENHVHVLRAQVANFGVTEGQYLSMALNLFSAVMGPATWALSVHSFAASVLGLQLPAAALGGALQTAGMGDVAIVVGGLFPCLLSLSTFVSVARSGTNLARALLLTLPLVVQQGLMVFLACVEPGRSLFEEHPVVFLAVQGLLHSHLSNRIILASVCREELTLVHSVLLPAPVIAAVVGLVGWRNGGSGQMHSGEQALVVGLLVAYAVAIAIQYAHFVVTVINAICKHLNIKCFSITPKKE